MDLLIDMNLTPRWAEYLSRRGHHAIHWASVGHSSATDQEIFDYARGHRFVLLTNDLDFPRILAHTKECKPSVMLLRGEPLIPETRGAGVVQALSDCAGDLSRGAIVSLDWSDQARARVLPLD